MAVASEPFLNFHVDVSICSSLFFEQFCAKFSERDIELQGHPEVLARYEKLQLRPATSGTLKSVLQHAAFESLPSSTGFMYKCHQRVGALFRHKALQKPSGRAGAAAFSFGGVAASAVSDDDDDYRDESAGGGFSFGGVAASAVSDDDDGYSEADEDEDLQPVGGQLNCWLQLNREGLALPTLGFLPTALHEQLSDALELQDIFSQVADERVAAQIQEIVGDDGVFICTENCRGRALIWDAKSVWHSAVWLLEDQLVAAGVDVSAEGRDSIELRFHTLSMEQVDVYCWVLLDELCLLLLHAIGAEE